MPEKKKIGELMIEQGFIDKYQLKAALNRQERWGKRLGETLVEMGFVSEDVLLTTLSKILSIPSIKPDKFEISRNVISLIPGEICRRLSIIPLAIKIINNKKRFVVAMSDPSDYAAIDEIQFLTNLKILPMIATSNCINATIGKYYSLAAAEGAEEEDKSEISMISRSAKTGSEYMEVIREGRQDVVKIGNSQKKNNRDGGIVIGRDQFNEVTGEKREPMSEFGKAIEEKLENFDLGENQAKPEPLVNDEYEESTGVFKDDNVFNKLVKILKNKSLLSDNELKAIMSVARESDLKSIKGAKVFKLLVEILYQKKMIDEKEKKILDEG